MPKIWLKVAASCLSLLAVIFSVTRISFAAPPSIISYQGRLANASGDLLGSSSGQTYYFRFSIHSDLTGGTQLWPAGTPAIVGLTVQSGVFNALIGDTTAGFDALTLDFESDPSIFLQVQISQSADFSSSETLAPRQRVVSSGYAINSDTVDGAHAGTAANNVLRLGASAEINLSTFFDVAGTAAPAVSGAGEGRIYFDSTTNTFRVSENGGAYTTLVGGGASGWTDGGTDIALTTSTDNVGIGGASLAKLSVDGDVDEIQFLVQGNSTQTSNLVVFENSSGTDVFTVTNAGNVSIAGTLTTSGNLDMQNNLILNIGDAGTDFTAGGGLTLAGTLDANGNVSIADTDIAFDGASTTFTTTGAFTLTPGGAVLLGDGGDTMQINTSDWDISTTGAMTGIGAITMDGTLTISGVAADITTGINEDLTLVPNGTGDVVIDTDANTTLTLNGGGDGVDSLVLTDGDILVSDGDLDLSGGDFNVTLDAGDGVNIAKGAAPTVDVFTINGGTSATDGVNALQLTFTSDDASGTIINISPTFTDNDANGLGEIWNVFEMDSITVTQNDSGAAVNSNVRGININTLTENATGDDSITSSAISIATGWDTDINAVTSLEFGIDGASELNLTSTAFSPSVTDSTALGTTSSMWSDFFLASGGVLNWANGEVTLTESDANTLALGGGNLDLGTNLALNIGDAGTDFTAGGGLTLAELLTVNDEVTVNLAAGEDVAVGVTAAPTVDMVNISNVSNGSTTAGVDGLSIGFTGINVTGSAISSLRNVAPTSNPASEIIGHDFQLSHTTTVANTGTEYGLQGTAQLDAAVAGQNMYGGRLRLVNASSGTITTGGGLSIPNALNTGGGAITTQYGIAIDDLTSATTDVGLYIQGADTYAILVDADDVVFDANAVVGGSTSRTETLANAGFSLGGDDLFVAGLAGIEGNVYTDGSFIAGATTTYGNGTITTGSNENLTITPGGTGDLIISTDADSQFQLAGQGGLVIAPTTTGTFLDFQLETEWTSGTLMNADFAGATTQTGAMTGFALDFGTNVTGANAANQTGIDIELVGGAFSGSGTESLRGIVIDSDSGLTQNTAAGTIAWLGIDMALPTITQSTGSVTANGVNITIPSSAITTGGTMQVINIVGPSTGPAAGSLTGVNITGITTPGAGTETALSIGSGWDTMIDMPDMDIDLDGNHFALADGNTLGLDGDGSPAADLMEIGLGDTVATDGVSALILNLDFDDASGALLSFENYSFTDNDNNNSAENWNIIGIDPFTATHSDSGGNPTATIDGIDIGALTEAGTDVITSTGISVGSGWDDAININSSAFIAETTGAIAIDPTTTGTFLDFELATQWDSGTLINADFGGANTQTGDMTGLSLNFNTNLTGAADSDVTGLSVQTPALTAASAVATIYAGYTATGGAISNLDAGGSVIWRGAAVVAPNITQTAGAIGVAGYRFQNGTITTGGTEIGFMMVPSGVGAGTLDAFNAGTISSPGAGIETAFSVGTGWDSGLVIGDVTTEISLSSTSPTIAIGNGGTLTATDGTNTLFSLADQGTTSTAAVGGFAASANVTLSAGRDFLVPTGASGNQLSVFGNFTEATSGTHATIASLSVTAPTVTDGGGTEAVTNLATLYVSSAPTAGTTPTNGPYALFIDSGAARFDGNIQIADGATLTFEDTSGNDMLVLADVSTASNHTLTGDVDTGLVLSGMTTDLATVSNQDLTIAPNGTGDVVIDTDSDTQLTLNGGGDGVDSLVLTDGDILVSDGDFDLSGGDFNVTLDAGDGASITSSASTASIAALTVSHTTSSTNVGSTGAFSVSSTLTDYADDGASDTRMGFSLTVTNNATDAGTDDLIRGMIINNLAGSNNADGTEIALTIGNNWDSNLTFADTTTQIQVSDTGLITFEDDSGNDIFVLADTSTASNHVLTGDADTGLTFSGMTTDITTGTNETLTIAPNGTGDVSISVDDDTELNMTGTVTNEDGATDPGELLALALTLGNDAAVDEVAALDIRVTNTATGDADILRAINIAAITDQAVVDESAFEIGTGWGAAITTNEGDIQFGLRDSDDVVVTALVAPTIDMVLITNQDTDLPSVTNGVDALQLTFKTSNASGNVIDITPTHGGNGSDTYNVIDIDAFTATTSAGTDTVRGLNIGTLTEAGAGAITSTGIAVGSGWDDAININSSAFIAETTGALAIDPTTTGTFLDFELATQWTFGTLMAANFASATSQGAGNIIGLDLDFDTNVTGTASRNVTGVQVQTPTMTDTTGATTTYQGFLVAASGALTANHASADIGWQGVAINMPALTQTSGVVGSAGISVLANSANASGDQRAIETNDIDTGPAAGSLVSVDIGGITTPGAGEEIGLRVNTGWDIGISTESGIGVGPQATLTANSTSPSVRGGSHWITANTLGTVISNFTNGTTGQIIVVEINDTNTDFDCTASSLNCGSADIITPAAGDTFTFMRDATIWNLISWMDASAVQTGADIAEYMYSDTDLAPGTVVVAHPTRKEAVAMSPKTYDATVVGIVSDVEGKLSDIRPGLILGEGRGNTPVTLAGRVMAAFDATNGPAFPGDPLTTSTSGRLMVAKKAGPIVGKALSLSENGYVIVLANIGWYNPTDISQVSDEIANLREQVRIAQEESAPADLTLATVQNLAGRVYNLEILSSQPAQELSVLSNRVHTLEEAYAEVTKQVNYSVAQLNAIADRTSSLETRVSAIDSAIAALEVKSTPALDLSTLDLSGTLIVQGMTTLSGGLQVNSVSAVGSEIAFASDLVFFGRPYFNADTGGFVVIKEGQREVEVTFEKEYLEQPVVNAAISLEELGDSVLTEEQRTTLDSIQKENLLKQMQEEYEEALFVSGVRFLVTRKSTKGFMIRLSQAAEEDIRFSWIALAVKDARTFTNTNITIPQAPLAAPISEDTATEEATASAQSVEEVVEPVPAPTEEPVIEPVVEEPALSETVSEPASAPVIEEPVPAPVEESAPSEPAPETSVETEAVPQQPDTSTDVATVVE